MPGEAIAEAYDAFEKGQSIHSPLTAAAVSNQTIQESMKLVMLVRAYQVRSAFTNQSDAGARAAEAQARGDMARGKHCDAWCPCVFYSSWPVGTSQVMLAMLVTW